MQMQVGSLDTFSETTERATFPLLFFPSGVLHSVARKTEGRNAAWKLADMQYAVSKKFSTAPTLYCICIETYIVVSLLLLLLLLLFLLFILVVNLQYLIFTLVNGMSRKEISEKFADFYTGCILSKRKAH
jgi:hypothetical protein